MATQYTTLTPEEVAEALGASPWWVREQARRGRIPHLLFGRGKIRFLPEHVDALVRLVTVEGRQPDDEPSVEASVDLGALGATVKSIRAHQRRPHVQGDAQLY
ncbi:helix-turn-helix domain-containing protein [uncultured Cellulomonas sp.]|uniref:helix-turn-helix domain-containing protein n=1 Tax=uncultured Cellulomonas sp. TaxID=189682 RepID=UPI0028E6DF36|nr:helix-turn-helix domain-containing protein [uncultured Cellulomonas sp.]